jgi:hypothetical protein
MPAPVNPNKGQLDQTQIMQRAFDETTDRLRTDAAATIVAGSLEVIISDVDDSIKIGDGSGTYVSVKAASTTPVAADRALVVSLSPNTAPVVVSGTVAVSNFPATQVVSGTVSISGSVAVTGPLTDAQLRASAVPISAASLPLPSGAATSALQTTGNTSLSSIDSKIPSGLTVTSTRLLVDGSGVTQPVSGTVSVSGTVAISAASLPLPIGASTSALQTTGNSSLSSIDSKFNTLGQKTMAASAPIVIASDQTVIPVSDNGGSITVDGTVSISGSVAVTGPLTDTQLRASAVPVSGSGNFTVVQTTGTNLHTVVDSGSITVANASGASAVNIQDGGNSITVDATSLPLPTGASTSALQTTGNTSLSSIDTKIPANLTVTSTRLLVDGSGVTQPVSGTVTANQGGAPWSSNTTQLAGTAIAVNAGTANAGTQRVVIASDQTKIPFETVSTSSVTSVTVTASTTNLLSSTSGTKSCILYNDSGRNLYVKFGATASTTSFTIRMGDNTVYELPMPIYTGQIDAIASAGSGPMRITELT